MTEENTTYTKLRQLLTANGITTTYTDQELDAFLLEAKLLIGEDWVFPHQYKDYVHKWDGDTYVLDYYPVLTGETVTVKVNDVTREDIIDKVTSEGIVYFKHSINGSLEITYTVGLPDEDVVEYLLPITVAVVEDILGRNVASVTEGDVSVSYSSTSTKSQTESLIGALREKYCARLCVL